MFENIQVKSVDNLLALMEEFHRDQRGEKVDLVVGVYKDDQGNVPVMKAVKQAEAELLESETTKNYVGMAGDGQLRQFIPKLLLGDDNELQQQGRFDCVQTPGGTGALKVAFDFLNKINPANKVWMSTPTWANHIPVATTAGLTVDQYPYFRASDRQLDFSGMIDHLENQAKPSEIILLHACCHNPTGVDLSFDQWQQLTEVVQQKKLLPLIDCAYQGLGKGMDEDAAGMRYMINQVPEALIANSFSKNFGIYRERTGGLSFLSANKAQTAAIFNAVKSVIRSNYSMPPSHGGRIVATILNQPELILTWQQELNEVRERILKVRSTLKAKLEQAGVTEDLSFLTDQTGMFSYTGFTPEAVTRLKQQYGIYMAADGRINVAGVCSTNIDYICKAFASVLK